MTFSVVLKDVLEDISVSVPVANLVMVCTLSLASLENAGVIVFFTGAAGDASQAKHIYAALHRDNTCRQSILWSGHGMQTGFVRDFCHVKLRFWVWSCKTEGGIVYTPKPLAPWSKSRVPGLKELVRVLEQRPVSHCGTNMQDLLSKQTKQKVAEKIKADYLDGSTPFLSEDKRRPYI